MILVTGATGKVGFVAVAALLEREVPVRALVRDRARAQSLAQAGVEIAVGDFGLPASLKGAMDGVTTVLLISPGADPAHELAVIDAAAGVNSVDKKYLFERYLREASILPLYDAGNFGM